MANFTWSLFNCMMDPLSTGFSTLIFFAIATSLCHEEEVEYSSFQDKQSRSRKIFSSISQLFHLFLIPFFFLKPERFKKKKSRQTFLPPCLNPITKDKDSSDFLSPSDFSSLSSRSYSFLQRTLTCRLLVCGLFYMFGVNAAVLSLTRLLQLEGGSSITFKFSLPVKLHQHVSLLQPYTGSQHKVEGGCKDYDGHNNKERIESMLVACECFDNRPKKWCPYLHMLLITDENMFAGNVLSPSSI